MSLWDLPARALNETLKSMIYALPKAITAVIIIFLGWVLGKISEVLVRKFLKASEIDKWLEEKGLKKSLYNISVEQTVGVITKYYIILIFLKEAAIRAGLMFLADLFGSIINAVPQYIIGAAIIIISLVFADFVRRKIKNAIFPFKDEIGEAVYGIIIFFAIVMALPKFGLTNTSLLEDSFKYLILGVSIGISIAIGIGFGWAIKEGPAKEFFKKKK